MKRGEMLNKALILMVNAHADQFDKGGAPYSLHPLKVMHYTKSQDEEILQIAIMHDIVEDTSTTYQDLRELGFSERVIAGVAALTKIPGETVEEYQLKVLANDDACLVKMADLRHNSDIRRLKTTTEVSEKDILRTVKYYNFYLRIQNHLKEKEKKV